MKLALLLLMAVTLRAQDPPKVDPPKPEKTDAPKVDAPTVEPRSEQSKLTGSIDFGYRWLVGSSGSFDTYRSVVNLGEGPKLFGLDFRFEPAAKKLFDRIDVRASNWGGEPSSTAQAEVRKLGVYSLSFDYRNLAYFDALPSFADPTLDRGVVLNQKSFDVRRRYADLLLEMRPGSKVIPFLGWTHSSGSGHGVTDYVVDGNNYPVANLVRDKTDEFRGGVRFELKRWHLGLEEGGSIYKDDQQVSTNTRNLGNNPFPFLGQPLYLDQLLQAYGVRSNGTFTRATLAGSPTNWLDVRGQFLFSQPSTDTNYFESAKGQFVDFQNLLFYTSRLDRLAFRAKQPHTSGSASAEVRPFERLRIVESWMTDRLHVGSDYAQNYNEQQIEAFYDVAKAVTVRGGYRYVWGDLREPGTDVSGLAIERAEMRRHVGLAGLTYHPSEKLRLNADFEAASGDRTFYRTSLRDYQRLRTRGRYQLFPTVALTGAYTYFDNTTPGSGSSGDYNVHQQSGTAGVLWTPAGGSRLRVSAEYTRFQFRTELSYLVPQTLTREISLYQDNAHTGTVFADVSLWKGTNAPRFTGGGAFFRSSGSRASQYTQPYGRLTAPLTKHVQWWAEWRWYDLTQTLYAYEAFRTHTFSTGLRLTR
ncbi:MAG: MtrB/PioB family outer membrane beta-barrel protein [Bryobacteraceae bacterium]